MVSDVSGSFTDLGKMWRVSRVQNFKCISRAYAAVLQCENGVRMTENPCPDDGLEKDVKQPKIVIIGAGIAGLTAAHRLIETGFTDVTVLEGQNRCGGRLNTCELNGSLVDLGAQWIRGADVTNSVFSKASQEGLIELPLIQRDPFRGNYVSSDGTRIKKNVQDKSFESFKKLLCMCPESLPLEADHSSLWDYFLKGIQKEMEYMEKEYKGHICRVLHNYLIELKNRIGADLNDVPLEKYMRYRAIPGGDVALTKGFGSLAQSIVNDLPKDTVKLEEEVINVTWSRDVCTGCRAMVRTFTGNVYCADFVISTASVGVLKSHHKAMFNPPLPAEKADAIQNLGYGHINKVFFKYDKPFWIKGSGFVRPIWTMEELNEKEHWMSALGLIDESPHSEDVLSFTIGGSPAINIESLTDECLINQFTRVLHQLTRNSTLPFPSAISRSRWSSCRFTQGGNSYQSTATQPRDVENLAAPLPHFCQATAPTLLFAGEATVQKQQGTVNGARLSGFREAERILAVSKRFGGPPPTDNRHSY